ncbi:MAG: ATP-binding cassette domain-containing protein, partial [Rhodospirillales bacterium]|nr:ATP-binding cassette domain-containing protein [Rhodospirillales bacterium]
RRQNITRSPTHLIARAGVGWVPDDRRLCPTLTVARNLAIGMKSSPYRPWTVDEVSDIFSPLKYLMAREAETLSGGEMQMVAIARCLLGAPGLALFDEPSQGLAPKIVDDVLSVIRRLKQENVATIMVEQNADVALEVADRVTILSHGQVVWKGKAGILRGDADLKRRMLGGPQ